MTGRTDLEWLDYATVLGCRGRGRVHPNPEVGCVIVRDGVLVGEGHHAEFGGPHAEVVALREAAGRAEGATAFISLEPCAHHGKTPPCTEAIIEARVGRVVFGAPDPTPEGSGGAAMLEGAGLEVTGPLFDPDRARFENPAFTHWAERGTPWIQVKLAMSLDGRIAAAPGARTAISGSEAGDWVHGLRANSDAVLVGRATAVVDNPLLTVRHGVSCVRQPTRVVLDSEARLPPDAAMLHEEGGQVQLFVGPDAPGSAVKELEQAGARVTAVAKANDEPGLDLDAVMSELAAGGVRSMLCEGGGVLASALISKGLVQRVHLILSPVGLGPSGVPAFTDEVTFAGEAWRAFDALRTSDSARTLGRDGLVSFRREY